MAANAEPTDSARTAMSTNVMRLPVFRNMDSGATLKRTFVLLAATQRLNAITGRFVTPRAIPVTKPLRVNRGLGVSTIQLVLPASIALRIKGLMIIKDVKLPREECS
jgi:hypothetical protein